MSGLDYERCILAAGPVGIMQACVDTSFTYMHQREQFNEKIGKFQVNYWYSVSRVECGTILGRDGTSVQILV